MNFLTSSGVDIYNLTNELLSSIWCI